MITWPFRIILFLVTALCFLYGSYLIGCALVIFLSLQYNAYEYVALAFCIDCYFSPDPITFWYTTVLTTIVLLGIMVQPFIRREPIRE